MGACGAPGLPGAQKARAVGRLGEASGGKEAPLWAGVGSGALREWGPLVVSLPTWLCSHFQDGVLAPPASESGLSPPPRRQVGLRLLPAPTPRQHPGAPRPQASSGFHAGPFPRHVFHPGTKASLPAALGPKGRDSITLPRACPGPGGGPQGEPGDPCARPLAPWLAELQVGAWREGSRPVRWPLTASGVVVMGSRLCFPAQCPAREVGRRSTILSTYCVLAPQGPAGLPIRSHQNPLSTEGETDPWRRGGSGRSWAVGVGSAVPPGGGPSGPLGWGLLVAPWLLCRVAGASLMGSRTPTPPSS